VYAGGGFGSIGGQLRSNIAAIDASSGAATSWDPDAFGSVLAWQSAGEPFTPAASSRS
jgi:hypothetical protein